MNIHKKLEVFMQNVNLQCRQPSFKSPQNMYILLLLSSIFAVYSIYEPCMLHTVKSVAILLTVIFFAQRIYLSLKSPLFYLFLSLCYIKKSL